MADDRRPVVRVGVERVRIEAEPRDGEALRLDLGADVPRLVAGQARNVDVVITDLFMPGTLDGIDLIKAIRALPPPQPALIAISGDLHRAARSSLQTARHLGADASFMKPVDRTELVATIRRLAGGGPALV